MNVKLIASTQLEAGWSDTYCETSFTRGALECRDAELVIEFAGRNCYQSWHNPANKTNQEYIRHLLECGHGSVLEHASATFFITGVSRSLTHELIRHRHLSFSELSQRYVDVENAEFVMPPAFNGHVMKGDHFKERYAELVTSLVALGLPRKRVREAARCVMPNCTETKIVVTGNFRAWRGVIDQRATIHADLEIRQLAVNICQQLQERFPACFGDYEVYTDEDGYPSARTTNRKV